MATREAILDDPILDTEMAGYVAGVSARRVRELVQRGDLTNYGSRGRILLRLSDVTAYRNPKNL